MFHPNPHLRYPLQDLSSEALISSLAPLYMSPLLQLKLHSLTLALTSLVLFLPTFTAVLILAPPRTGSIIQQASHSPLPSPSPPQQSLHNTCYLTSTEPSPILPTRLQYVHHPSPNTSVTMAHYKLYPCHNKSFTTPAISPRPKPLPFYLHVYYHHSPYLFLSPSLLPSLTISLAHLSSSQPTLSPNYYYYVPSFFGLPTYLPHRLPFPIESH